MVIDSTASINEPIRFLAAVVLGEEHAEWITVSFTDDADDLSVDRP